MNKSAQGSRSTAPPAKLDDEPISGELIQQVCTRLDNQKSVRQALPGGGRLNIDRMLPFLCVYRRQPTRRDGGTSLFVTSEASYLLAPGLSPARRGLKRLVQQIAETSSRRLGAFLIFEIWSSEDDQVPKEVDELTGETILPRARFCIHTSLPHRPEGAVATLQYALQRIRIFRQTAEVQIQLHTRNHPGGLSPLISAKAAQAINCFVLGLEVRPVYREPAGGEVYDSVLRTMQRGVSRGLKRAFFAFALHRTNVRPQHYFALGRRSLAKQVFNVDRELADVSGQFKFLLLVTPINAERSWHQFAESNFQSAPQFQYRPLDTDPLLLKRRLARIRTERIDDPTLAHLMRQTQDELDRQITMLSDIGTSRFLPGSLQVFGTVEPSLLDLARQILQRVPVDHESTDTHEHVDAKTIARQAEQEFKNYRRQSKAFAAKAVVCDDMYSGLLSTGGNLLIGRETRIVARRVWALLQHEVGTHLVTFFNGQSQPLRLLCVGLAGYDEMQEGLAVLAEYLVGGLSRGRMRTLAARVVATHHMVCGESFASTFALLTEQHGFEHKTAFTITLRVYRGRGLTKDAVYLRGLVEVLAYLGKKGELDPLYIGKIAADHLPVMRELLLRGVLRTPVLRPTYLDDAGAKARLEKLRGGMSVLDLLPELT